MAVGGVKAGAQAPISECAPSGPEASTEDRTQRKAEREATGD